MDRSEYGSQDGSEDGIKSKLSVNETAFYENDSDIEFTSRERN